jgi:hypothetical protein
MMRKLSSNITALMQSGETAETIYLIRITDKIGTLVYADTTHTSDVTLSNGFVYPANGNLVSADPPQQSTTVDREQYKIVIADPEMLLGALAESNFVGKRLEVRIGFLNPNTGLPYTTVDDTFIIYAGSVDSASYKVSTEEYGESLFQVSGVSPIVSLDMKRGLYLSKDAVRQRNPQDSCCDQIYEGSGTSVLKWGKG